MVFCGQCGYQLSPGDQVCPRCGAKTDIDLIEQDAGAYNPTEVSHALLNAPPQVPYNRGSQVRQPEQQGPLILGPITPGDQVPGSDAATTMMSSQMPTGYSGYPPQQMGMGTMNQPMYPQQGYPSQAGTGIYGYQQHYQAGQTAAVAQLLAASRRGKVTSLLLILFGILLLVGAIIIFLLTQQGVIFA